MLSLWMWLAGERKISVYRFFFPGEWILSWQGVGTGFGLWFSHQGVRNFVLYIAGFSFSLLTSLSVLVLVLLVILDISFVAILNCLYLKPWVWLFCPFLLPILRASDCLVLSYLAARLNYDRYYVEGTSAPSVTACSRFHSRGTTGGKCC